VGDFLYSQKELSQIRDTISSRMSIAPEQLNEFSSIIKESKLSQEMSSMMFGFSPLYFKNQKLYKKISKDPHVEMFSAIAFFPAVYDLVYKRGDMPFVYIPPSQRKLCVMVLHDDTQMMIKSTMSDQEYGISMLADRLDVGLKQYKTLDGYITEELCDGQCFGSKLLTRNHDYVINLGMRIGEILGKLHENKIFYNNSLMAVSGMRPHILLRPNNTIALFDYSNSVLVEGMHNLTDEQIFLLAASFPMMNQILTHKYKPHEEFQSLVDEWRPIIERHSPCEFFMRDKQTVTQELNDVLKELDEKYNIKDVFMEGFNRTYR